MSSFRAPARPDAEPAGDDDAHLAQDAPAEEDGAAPPVVEPHHAQRYPPAPPRPSPAAGDAGQRTPGASDGHGGHGGHGTLPPPPDTGPQPVWAPPSDSPPSGGSPAQQPPPQPRPPRAARQPAAPTSRGAGPAAAGDATGRPPPTPEQAAAFSRSVLRFGVLVLVAMFSATFPLPWLVVAPVAAVAAIVAGVRMIVGGRRLRATSSIAFGVVGLALCALFLVSSTSTIALWPIQMERQQCLERALTHSARDACEAAYSERLSELTERLGG